MHSNTLAPDVDVLALSQDHIKYWHSLEESLSEASFLDKTWLTSLILIDVIELATDT